MPPTKSSFSNTLASTPFRLRTRAAANPAAPAPMTATFRSGRCLLAAAAAAAAGDDDDECAAKWRITIVVDDVREMCCDENDADGDRSKQDTRKIRAVVFFVLPAYTNCML